MSKELQANSSVEDPNQTGEHVKNMKNISELFALVNTTKISAEMLLIEGAPGIGKTILSKEIAYQWANNSLLQSKKLLFLVFLRNLYSFKIQSVEQFVQHVLRSSEMAASIGKYLIESNGKDLVLVLDGYDELSEIDRKESFIAQLMKRQVLSKCLLVITSRPTTSLALRGSADCRVEIVGFTERDRLDYIKNAIPNSLEKVTSLQNYLKSNPTINALCYIPLNMTILLCLCEHGLSNLPKTQTEMYRKFIEMTIIRFLEKVNETKFEAAGFTLSNLPYPHNTVFQELSQFAFEALACDKLVFELTELQRICPSLTASPSSYNGLGLLNSFTYFNGGDKIVTYHFLHFSIQEYIAAYHISILSEKEQLQLMQEKFWSADYYNTWIMYVGITGGETFSLKHFLSGNFFQIFTKLFKAGISNKFLNDKIKSLHIFQCLVEAQNTDLISSFDRLFQNQEIDLSGQTLLPRDLNTLGFFLVRSISKHWKKLNLSRCNMGDAGLKILTERFVDKNVYSSVRIDRVDLSCNQIDFSSLAEVLKLLKAWKTAEIIATDGFTCGSETACNVFEAVKHVFLQSNDVVILKTVLLGSFLFAYKLHENEIIELLTNTQKIEAMYLIYCSWGFSNFDTKKLFRNQKLINAHFLGDFVGLNFLQAVVSSISRSDSDPSLLIDDPTLPDQVADEIFNLLPISVSRGIMIVASATKVQGVINACSLSSELSNIEILNLIRRIRILCSYHFPVVTSWDKNLQWYGHKSEGIIETFVKALFFLCKNTCNFRFKIGLVEGNSLIAHAMKSEEINTILSFYGREVSSIYLSSCFIRSDEWSSIVIDYSNISSLCLHIINCQVKVFNMLLYSKTIILRELFVHNAGNVSSDDVEAVLSGYSHASVVVVTKDTMAVCNPTSKQLAMAYQLEPSVTVWKFFCCKLHANTFKQIVQLLIYAKQLNKLKFVGCSFGNLEFEMFYNQFVKEQPTAIIQELYSSSLIPSFKMAKTLGSTLTEFHINDNNLAEEAANYIAAVVLSSNRLQVLNLAGNDLQTAGMIKIAKALQDISSLTELYLDSNKITEGAVDDIAAVILHNRNLKKLDLDGNYIITTGMRRIAIALQSNSCLTRFYADGNHFTAEAADDIAAFIRNNSKMQILGLGKNILTGLGIVIIAKALQNLSTLTELFINNNQITDSAADDIEAVILNNRCLRKLDIGDNNFTSTGLSTIAKALQTLSSLIELYISNNNIDCDLAKHVAAVILSNTNLQKLDLSRNRLQAAGVMIIAKALQNISSLTELYINKNQITESAKNDIAGVILSNTKIQKLDLSNNYFHSSGIIKIAQALQTVSSLLELNIHNNFWDYEASPDIAAVFLANPKLQKSA